MSSKGQNRQRRRGEALQKKVRESLGLEAPLLYDPPGGWHYGFPKPYNPLPGESLSETLVRDGYPRSDAEGAAGMHVRFFGCGKKIDLALRNLTKQWSKK